MNLDGPSPNPGSLGRLARKKRLNREFLLYQKTWGSFLEGGEIPCQPTTEQREWFDGQRLRATCGSEPVPVLRSGTSWFNRRSKKTSSSRNEGRYN